MTALDIKYRNVLLEISQIRGWNVSNSMVRFNTGIKNSIIIEFDKIPLVKRLIFIDRITPRKDYIYRSPDGTIEFDCQNIYGLLHIQMLNIIERYLVNNEKELYDELRKNSSKVHFYLTEICSSLTYRYSFHTLKIDDEK